MMGISWWKPFRFQPLVTGVLRAWASWFVVSLLLMVGAVLLTLVASGLQGATRGQFRGLSALLIGPDHTQPAHLAADAYACAPNARGLACTAVIAGETLAVQVTNSDAGNSWGTLGCEATYGGRATVCHAGYDSRPAYPSVYVPDNLGLTADEVQALGAAGERPWREADWLRGQRIGLLLLTAALMGGLWWQSGRDARGPGGGRDARGPRGGDALGLRLAYVLGSAVLVSGAVFFASTVVMLAVGVID